MPETPRATFTDDKRIAFANGLTLRATDRGEGEVFEWFFAGFDKAFVLPNEKEDEAGFKACFDLNHGDDYKKLSAKYGPYHEVSVLAEENGVEIGGANFIAMPADATTITANLSYIFVNEVARGKGNLGRLVAAVREMIAGLFPRHARVLIFIEQNDPFRMSEDDYRRDTDFTGLDQIDRLRIWAKLGAKVVDFPYAQPPLSDDQEVDDTLLLSVIGADAPTLDACILGTHLRRFFGVSVLKAAPLEGNPAAWEQIEQLRVACGAGGKIDLVDPAPLLKRMVSRDAAFALWKPAPATFRDALRR
ncbi:MAG: hypothetical protein ABI740_10465 [Alphaproteobacteria bacterium]